MFRIKKQLTLIFFLSSLLSIQAQNETIYYGGPQTGGAQLHVADDNSYKVVLKHGDSGKIQIEDEEVLFLYNLDFENEGFKITEDLTSEKSDSINLHFVIEGIIIDEEDIYVGYQPQEESDIKYLNLCYETLLFNTENVKPFDRKLSFKIPRTEYLELVLKRGSFFIDRFKLSPNCSNVYIDYRYISDGIVDPSKLGLCAVNSEGEFLFDDRLFSTDTPPAEYVRRISSDSIAKWDMPFWVQQEAYKKFDSTKLNYLPVTTITPRSHESNVTEIQSLDEAIAKLKTDDSKILLIFNSLIGNNDEHYYRNILDAVHRDASYDYLSDYYLDRYILYFIKPEEIKELKKYKSEGVKEVIALNSDLEVIYKENIGAKNFEFKYNAIGRELSQNILAADLIYQFKKKNDTKTLTAKDFIELGAWQDHSIIEDAIEKKELDDEGLFEETDTGFGTVGMNNTRFNTKVDFYYPKINYMEIKEGLITVMEKHKSDKTIDIDFAKLAFDFISYYSFFENITGITESYDPEKEHYEFCLYLSRFPIETYEIQNEYTKSIDNHFFTIYDLLQKGRSKDQYSEIVIPTFENLLKIKEVRNYTIFIYYFYLFNQEKLSFEAFDTLFREIAPLSNNYLEQLDTYCQSCKHCPYLPSLEYYMSTLGNAVAWQAVTKHNYDKVLLTKALEWSKLSVEVSPEKHRYTDTYAHLLYFLGSTEEAMKIESNAIQQSSEGDETNLSKYKETLEKMQNGTLKY